MGYEADGFLAAIIAHPEEDGPRLIYADYLAEQGDPRAELIRVQVALARLGEFDPRGVDLRRAEAGLLTRFADVWANPFRGLATGPVFRRGFVEEVKVTARQFLAFPDALFRAGPVRHLHILDAAGHLAAVLASPHLMRLTGLTIFAQYLREPLGEGLAGCVHLGSLRGLYVARNTIGDAGVRWLGAAPWPHLTDLDLAENELTDATGRILAERFSNLVRLELSSNALGPAGAAALCGRSAFPRLLRLGLAGNRIGGKGLVGLPRPADLLRPAGVDLAANGLTAADLKQLFHGPVVGVRDLNLNHNPLGDDGILALAAAPAASGLRRLHLASTGLTDDSLIALARSPRLQRLEFLDVRLNRELGDAAFRTLLEPNIFPNLTQLAFPSVMLTLRTRLALERRFN